MSRSLSLVYLLLFHFVALASGQKYIYATFGGILQSWPNPYYSGPGAAAPTSAPYTPASVAPASVTSPAVVTTAPTSAVTSVAPTTVPMSVSSGRSSQPSAPSHTQVPASHSHSAASSSHAPPSSQQSTQQSTQQSSAPIASHTASSGQRENPGASGQNASAKKTSSGDSDNHALVIGLSVGLSLLAVIIIAIAAFFFIRRRKQSGYASAASSFNEEGKPGQRSAEDLPAQNPYPVTAQPTLPAVTAVASPRNSYNNGNDPFVEWSTGLPRGPQASQPWAPRTPSRLSQIPETAAVAERPPQHSIPRRPVGRDSL